MTDGAVTRAITLACLTVVASARADWMPIRFAQTRCLPEQATVSGIENARAGKCLKKWVRLGASGGAYLYGARYEIDELVTEVLYEVRPGLKSARPLWLTQDMSDVYEFNDVKLHRVGKRYIAEIAGCLRGTGGCNQDFVLWEPGVSATPIENVRKKFDASLPKGYTTLKAPFAHLDRMRIEGNGWKPRDANGGPSLYMECRLHFDGRDFSLSHCVRRDVP